MRPESIEIDIGTKKCKIRPLSLRQLREIEALTRDPSLGDLERPSKIIMCALSRDFPDLTEDDVEIPLTEVSNIVIDIFRLGGMESTPQGEPPLAPEQ